MVGEWWDLGINSEKGKRSFYNMSRSAKAHVVEALQLLRVETNQNATNFNSRTRKVGGEGLETHQAARRLPVGGTLSLRDGEGTSLVL